MARERGLVDFRCDVQTLHPHEWKLLRPLGSAVDTAVGHCVRDRAIRRFLDDLQEQLSRDLPPPDVAKSAGA